MHASVAAGDFKIVEAQMSVIKVCVCSVLFVSSIGLAFCLILRLSLGVKLSEDFSKITC